MKPFLFLPAIVLVFLFSACNSGPGPGGQASITGKIYAYNYNGTCTILSGEFYAPDEDVYLIYGDDPSYGDKVKSAPDGTFVFRYLRKGKYKVYCYSKDCSLPAGKKAVTVDVEITDKKQDVVVDDLKINK